MIRMRILLRFGGITIPIWGFESKRPPAMSAGGRFKSAAVADEDGKLFRKMLLLFKKFCRTEKNIF